MANSTFVSPTYVASQLQLIWYMTEFDPVIVREFSTSIPKRSTALVNGILLFWLQIQMHYSLNCRLLFLVL
ncbi:unnamed protein product [Rotaria magnacalcarata]|uniref:Uncharacterized protein n=1 Tax=Rotaria magnacalcarata TaxID=392030 RepID=A0A816D5L4_9BILA|nr:unnamed protein product [Rotaria magnacalcarata]CAF1630236.1 unnamed protein product [Rotaria magnacalcarata]